MTTFTVSNPDYAHHIRASFAKQGLMETLGVRMTHVAPGHVTLEVPFGERVSQQQGLFHGAVIGAIGDSAGGYAALSLMPADSEVVTVEYKVNFVRPARGVSLIAEGSVVRSGKSITVGRIDVFVTDDSGARNLVAVLQATFMRVAGG